MVVRAIALSLALLVGIGVIVPLATDTTEAGQRAAKKKKKRGWKGVKKYSKRWWQLYRAQERRKKSLRARKRSLKLRQLRLAKARAADPSAEPALAAAKRPSTPARTSSAAPKAVLPSGDKAPQGWSPSQTSASEMQFRVNNSSGDQVGSASISVVGPAVNSSTPDNLNRTVGGVATTSLRREVIDRMIRENGWVVNDYQKQISGQQVYIVEAQSQAKNGAVQSRMFYFTEVDGRIYSVATNSPVNESTRLAEESEKVINSLKTRVRPAQRASLTD
jgi:hypothetical protein